MINFRLIFNINYLFFNLLVLKEKQDHNEKSLSFLRSTLFCIPKFDKI